MSIWINLIFLSVGVTDVCVATDDEGGNIKPVSQPKKGSQSDLYMRLGLLLGDNARHRSRSRSHHRSSHHSHDSISSLASLDAGTLASSNTSPVSTLTGQFTIIFLTYHEILDSLQTGLKFLVVLMSISPHWKSMIWWNITKFIFFASNSFRFYLLTSDVLILIKYVKRLPLQLLLLN